MDQTTADALGQQACDIAVLRTLVSFLLARDLSRLDEPNAEVVASALTAPGAPALHHTSDANTARAAYERYSRALHDLLDEALGAAMLWRGTTGHEGAVQERSSGIDP